MTNDLKSLDVFYGDLSVNRAYFYARLPRPADDAGLSLSGQVRGPRCLHAETLPLTSPLIDLGPGPTLLARALVPDPCFWSPDLPAIYDVTVNLLRGSTVIATVRRELGLRALGVRGKHLSLEGKRWVLRGVFARSAAERLPRDWHDAQAAYFTDRTEAQELAECSQLGALAIVILPDHGPATVSQIRELSHFPGVAIVATEAATLPPDFNRSQVAPNLLLAQRLKKDSQPAAWADLMLAPADDPELLARASAASQLPVVATRFLAGFAPDLPTARAACDLLQRDLAPLGQFAGYIV